MEKKVEFEMVNEVNNNIIKFGCKIMWKNKKFIEIKH